MRPRIDTEFGAGRVVQRDDLAPDLGPFADRGARPRHAQRRRGARRIRHIPVAAVAVETRHDRSDGGRARPSATTIIRGAETVAESSVGFAELVPFARPALVNGEAGVVAIDDGKIACVVALTVTSGGIAAIEVLADSDRLDHIDAAAWS